MRGGTSPRGYTIVETMIFLAVSGFMFLIAAAFVSGKQNTAEFRQGINTINTQIQQVINDVANGFYPSNSDFSCTSSPSPGGLTINNVTTNEQGSNGGTTGPNQNGCVFLGKVIQFGDGTYPVTTSSIYTVAGSQYSGGSSQANLPQGFPDAEPTAVDYNYSTNVASPINLTQTSTLPWGLQVDSITYCPATSCGSGGGTPLPITSVGFFGSFSSYDANNDLVSGAQSTSVVVYTGTLGDPNTANDVADVNSYVVGKIANTTPPSNYSTSLSPHDYSDILINPDILICFSNGSNQFGSLTIGGTNGQRLTTFVQISSGAKPPGC